MLTGNTAANALQRAATLAYGKSHQLQEDAAAFLSQLEGKTAHLRKEVANGNLGLAGARKLASEHAAHVEASLANRLIQAREAPDAFRIKLESVVGARELARKYETGDQAMKRVARLLEEDLIERRAAARAAEFDARAQPSGAGKGLGGGRPVPPKIEDWLQAYQLYEVEGDSAGMEYSRRKAEALRPYSQLDEDGQARVDAVLSTPDRVAPRVVQRLVDGVKAAAARSLMPGTLEAFVKDAQQSGSATKVVAAVELVREIARSGAALPKWGQEFLADAGTWPDAAVNHVRKAEADRLRADGEAARLIVASAVAEAKVRAEMKDLRPPTEKELADKAHFDRMPKAEPGQPVGLAGHLPPSANPPTMPV